MTSAPKSAYDPTLNVIALNEASVKRLDDLAASEARRVNEQMALRAEFAEKLAIAEKSRIDAIRAVDVNAVAVASERASAQATVLANQFLQTSEALRSLVASTAESLTERLSKVEQAQYEGKGRSAYADPRFEELMNKVESLSESRAGGAGKAVGANALWGYIAGGIGIMLGFGGLIIALLRMAPK
jgi:hypothetical protein